MVEGRWRGVVRVVDGDGSRRERQGVREGRERGGVALRRTSARRPLAFFSGVAFLESWKGSKRLKGTCIVSSKQ